MVHAILFVLFSALLRKLGFRELRPDEEAILPSYFVKAERIRRVVMASVVWTGLAMALLVWILLGDWRDLQMPTIEWQQIAPPLLIGLLILFVFHKKFRRRTINITVIAFGIGSVLLSGWMIGQSYWPR